MTTTPTPDSEDAVDLTGDDNLIEPSDNSGEPGMPEEDQNPTAIPDGSVQ